jgi:hypothetical protein
MRNYRKEYDNYQGTEEQKKNRAERNKARRQAKAKGLNVHGKDVAHVKALSKGGSNKDGVKLQPPSTNRSFKRNKDGSMK